MGIGATVFLTGIFASLAAGYFLYTVFENILAAIFFGLLWGLMIFNLDRYIVSSMRKEGRVGKEFLMATPRLILAILISVVIAKPLELKIFDKEIQPELVLMEQAMFSEQEQVVKSKYGFAQDSLKKEMASLSADVANQKAKRDELLRIAQEEADGTGGSKKRNLGPIYKVKKADADKADEELQSITLQNNLRVNKILTMLEENESSLRKEIASLGRSRIDGPAARIEALDRIMVSSTAITWAHWFIILLFIAIETSPIFVKLISNKGPYDNLLKLEEHSFYTQEVEGLAKNHVHVKERTNGFPSHEKTFINDRLDEALEKS